MRYSQDRGSRQKPSKIRPPPGFILWQSVGLGTSPLRPKGHPKTNPVRIEIIQELDPDDARLEFPGAAPSRSGLRYVDLKRFPEKIGELPECRKFPLLRSLLSRVNARGLPIRTVKCDVWTTRKLAEDERLDFRLPSKTASYVDVVFDRPGLRTRLDAHVRFAERTKRALRAFRVQGQMDIVVRRCLFHPRNRWGYALTFFVHGYGATRSEATQEWGRALSALTEALSRGRMERHGAQTRSAARRSSRPWPAPPRGLRRSNPRQPL